MIKEYNNISKLMKFINKIMVIRKKFSKRTLLGISLKYHIMPYYYPKKGFIKNNIGQLDTYSIFKDSHKHLIYFHGGAYIQKGLKPHFDFLKKLSTNSDLNIHYIDYLLAPDYNVNQNIEATLDTTFKLIEKYNIKELYLSGDSAGGGLALILSKYLLEKNIIVKNHFLFSPWLDLKMDNLDCENLKYTEVSFTKEELLLCANMYTNNNLDSKDASPSFNDLSNIKNINIYAGTFDLIYPDILAFEKKYPNIILHSFKECPHAFAVIPFTKEQDIVIKDIINNT